MFKLLFLMFLLVPAIELYVLIEVGSVIGAGWTILLVLATAVTGAWLVKLQGIAIMFKAQATLAKGQPPALEMMEGTALVISGFLLLIPGFVTDVIGFMLLVPPLRKTIMLFLLPKTTIFFSQQRRSTRARTSQSDDIIEGEVVDDDDPRHLR